jgi:hypothetical protein
LYSAELWLWNGIPPDARMVTGVLFSRGGDALSIGGTSRGQGRLVLSSAGNAAEGRTELPLRQWRRVTLVRDAAALRVYLDGKLEAQVAAAAPPAPDFYFGASAAGESSFEGRLDEMAVWGRALSAGEISGRP